jgi:long-chain acyl-CoA synthetase
MKIDLDLYRREVKVGIHPPVHLSVIDIAPEHTQLTFVFLHGYGGYAKQWLYQLQEFSMRNRVVAIDLRGHGFSDKPASSYTMREIIEDIETVLHNLKVTEKIILVGHSFGGAIATEFAARHPQKVSHLILIASTGEYRLNNLYRFLLSLPYTFHHMAAPFTRRWLGAPPTVMKRWNDNNLAHWNGWSLFRGLEMPTLVIHGHRDRVFAETYFEEVTRAIPNAEEINVGASGHMVMLERRDAVNRAINRFLETTHGSWRDHDIGPSVDTELLHNRPWITHYETGIPATIAIPEITLDSLLLSMDRRFPKNTAMIYEGHKITYAQLNRYANAFANALRNMGINHGDRVMLLLPNLPDLVISFFGTIKIGGIVVFSLPFNEPVELIRQIKDSGARVLVTINQYNKLAAYAVQETGLEKCIFTDVTNFLPHYKQLALKLNKRKFAELVPDVPADVNSYSMKTLLRENQDTPLEAGTTSDDLAVIIYTGGTTAAPKGVTLSHKNLVANAFQTRHWMPDATEGLERFLCVLPFSHSYGLTASLTVPITLGATMILKTRFEVEDILKTIKRYKPTIFPGVPSMYVAISDFPGVRKYGISSIKACISGSAPLPVEVQEAFEKLTRGRLVEGYGLTEASPITHANPLNGLRKIGTIGIPLPSTEAKVVYLTNPTKEVINRQIGELAIRGPQVMQGYWNDQKATGNTLLPGGWLLTGDVVQMDEQGYFCIIARKADMWYPGKPGEPAFPRDIEEVLFEVPQVKEAAVVAIAGQPIAFVIAKSKGEQPTARKLIAYCERRLPPDLVPRLIIFVDDFPRTFIGKVIRRELAKHYERYQHEQQS